MSQRTATINLLKDYFDKKGEILGQREYRRQKDTPVRPEHIRRIFGSWARMENIVRKLDGRNADRPILSDVNDVIIARNAEVAEREALLRSIGEDQEQKHARELQAKRQIEEDALRAATPEGARENKVRKGGPEDWDARVKEESLQSAIATEHAMLAKTPAGAALGKELLGGVEDQDAKNEAIARQNARTERNALLAATPEGAAIAMMEEDDSDGKLTREAEVRIRNELRPFVAPAKNETLDEVFADEAKKLTSESQEVAEKLKSDEALSMGAAARGDAFGTVQPNLNASAPKNAPPADQAPDPSVIDTSIAEDVNFQEVAKPERDDEVLVKTSTVGVTTTPKAKINKETVNNASGENKDNPEAPPADRNPDPKLALVAEVKKDDKAKPAGKPAAGK